MERTKVAIMGAAGRDFHNFNVYFRDNSAYQVIGFTAAQIPNIAGRKYPPELSGKLYLQGIPIYPEEDLQKLIMQEGVEEVVFSYSDISYEELMHKASAVLAWGANFKLLGAEATMLRSTLPLVSVCAVRTGCGKSQTTRRVSQLLRELGKRVVVIRHPMPYGDLKKQRVQRFAVMEDMAKHHCTIEEMEEYEPHIQQGVVVYAGVDYEAILRQAEKEADVILWDGGNNDLPFYHAELKIVIADPHRPGHEVSYYPGEANLRMADVVVINKVDTAKPEGVEVVRRNIEKINPEAVVIEAASPIAVADAEQIRGRRVLVVEDGP
ncbi:MAG: GTPase, partial [Candidatus Aminicenantes bacterium]|nr:GTPase [Candidatus Aminicenantes bacterium]